MMQERSTSSAQVDKIESLASAINKMGLAGPASIALHIGRPLAWMGGQLLWALEPLLGSAARNRGNISLHSIASLLEREEDVDGLISRLEAGLQSRKEQHGS